MDPKWTIGLFVTFYLLRYIRPMILCIIVILHKWNHLILDQRFTDQISKYLYFCVNENLTEQIYYVLLCIYVRKPSINYLASNFLDWPSLAFPFNFILDNPHYIHFFPPPIMTTEQGEMISTYHSSLLPNNPIGMKYLLHPTPQLYSYNISDTLLHAILRCCLLL